MEVTLTAIKADVGSVGGHTRPSKGMVAVAEEAVRKAVADGLLIDGMAASTGDDTALLMSHTHGTGAQAVHDFAWNTFKAQAEVAASEGDYGAGQDLLVDAPSGTVKGAGPGTAEITFELLPAHRRAEAFLVIAGDKCAPGMFNLPLYLAFADPMHNSGLLLSPVLHKGFTITVIDMDHESRESDRIIRLEVPEESWDLAALLRDSDRFAIEAIHSRAYPHEQVVSVAATRLHNIAGTYTGKDDPIAIIRTQSLFPAPEEVLEPWATVHQIVTGDCRGSHNMPVIPMPANTAVTGPYAFPIATCLAFSMSREGKFTWDCTDMFGNPAWDRVRLAVQEKGIEFRRQGFLGVAMASRTELSYTGIVDTLESLERRFALRRD